MNEQESEEWGWTFHYGLSKEIYCKEIDESHIIKFVRNEQNNYIQSFNLTIENQYFEKAETISNTKADNIAKILTIKSGMEINVRLLDYYGKDKGAERRIGKTFHISYGIDGGIDHLDLDNPIIQKYVDSKDNDQIRSLSIAVSMIYRGNIVESIREAFRAVESLNEEGKRIKNYEKYSCIRHILTHPGPQYKPNTFNNFANNFGENYFDLERYEPANGVIILNWESQKTIRLLDKIARDLIKEIKGILEL